jgi:hypothetical protein
LPTLTPVILMCSGEKYHLDVMLSLVLVLTGALVGLLALAYSASVMAILVKPTADGKGYEILPIYHNMFGYEVTTPLET